MAISNFCVGFVVFIVLLVITGILGWLNMFVSAKKIFLRYLLLGLHLQLV